MDNPLESPSTPEQERPGAQPLRPAAGKIAYDIQADFHLLKTCNYRCDYCFYGPKYLGSKLNVFASNEEWTEGFDATGKTWLLHLTGGEPTLYPGFADLCERLSESHYLSLNSNLSHKSVLDFAKRVDPARVHYVNAGLHHEERRSRGKYERFIHHVRALQEHGFDVFVSLVMTPQMVQAYEDISADLRAQGIALVPKILQGKYGDKYYPRDYDPRERSALLSYLERACDDYADVLARMDERPTQDMFSDDRLLIRSTVSSYRSRLAKLLRLGKSEYAGRMCAAGSKFVVIYWDGEVRRCSTRKDYGNILRKDVRLLEGPKRCDTRFCYYYCEKYTQPRFLS